MLAGGAREASASGEPAGASSNIPRTGENPLWDNSDPLAYLGRRAGRTATNG